MKRSNYSAASADELTKFIESSAGATLKKPRSTSGVGRCTFFVEGRFGKATPLSCETVWTRFACKGIGGHKKAMEKKEETRYPGRD
eukprot:2149606-Pleurochrysis_carterae.AAC.1